MIAACKNKTSQKSLLQTYSSPANSFLQICSEQIWITTCVRWLFPRIRRIPCTQLHTYLIELDSLAYPHTFRSMCAAQPSLTRKTSEIIQKFTHSCACIRLHSICNICKHLPLPRSRAPALAVFGCVSPVCRANSLPFLITCDASIFINTDIIWGHTMWWDCSRQPFGNRITKLAQFNPKHRVYQ